MRLKYLFLLASFFVGACSFGVDHKPEMIRNTVKITNIAGNSGGSGSIVAADDSGSSILTNAHVCQVVRHGGVIHTQDGIEAFVQTYKQSETHDLCLIRVLKNLGHAARVATTPPSYYSKAISSGHPQLLPLMLSEGYFSDEKTIQVLIDMRECNDADKADPTLGIFCAVFGKLPVLKNYESTVVSVLVQPGSSGSAIYNSDGEISAVVFAGSGDMSFGFAVPHRYVWNFLTVEQHGLPEQKPDYSQNLADLLTPSKVKHSEFLEKLKETCEKHKDNHKVADLCSNWFRG